MSMRKKLRDAVTFEEYEFEHYVDSIELVSFVRSYEPIALDGPVAHVNISKLLNKFDVVTSSKKTNKSSF